jgi:RNA polymerase alpha subunit
VGSSDRFPIVLFARPHEIHLPERALSCTRSLGISWVGELVQCTEAELLRTPGTGRKTLADISAALKTYGLRLGMYLPDWSNSEAKQVRKDLAGTFRRKLFQLNAAPSVPSMSLDEEVLRALRITESDRNVGLLRSLWGLDGSERKTLETVGSTYSMTRERVRQIEARASENLGRRWHAMPLLDKAIAIVERHSPSVSSDLSTLLAQGGVPSLPISGKSLLCAANIFERETRLVLGGRPTVPLIGFREDLRFINEATRELRRATHATGCTSLSRIALILGKPLGAAVKLQKIFGHFPDVIWLGPGESWAMSANASRNRLLNYLHKVFAIAERVHITELRQALSRPHRMEYVPPVSVLLDICRRFGLVSVEGDWVARTGPPADVRFGEVDSAFIDAFWKLGTPSTRETLEDYCVEERNMNVSTFYVYLTYSPLFLKFAPGVYGLIGSPVPPGSIEAARARIRSDRVQPQFGWTSRGQLWCLLHIPRANLNSGTFFVPAFIVDHAEGRWTAKLASGIAVGECEVSDGFAKRLRSVLDLQGAEPGDFCLLTFDMPSKSVVVEVGGPDLEDRAPGGIALDLSMPEGEEDRDDDDADLETSAD